MYALLGREMGPNAPVARRCQDTHSSPLGVVISKDNGHIETASAAERNQASGPDFHKAMIRTDGHLAS
jgi:hypothetical protein